MSALRWLLCGSFFVACKSPVAPPPIPPTAADVPLAIVEAEDLDGDSAGGHAGKPDDAEPKRKCPLAEFELPAEPKFPQARSRIAQLRRYGGAPSVAVAVGHGGKIVWAEGFGLADKRRRIRATADTMYSLASISKPITATGIMVLRQDGKLDLDKPINDYLGEVGVRAGAGDPAKATVERVANHTSGLPLHYRFFYGEKPPTYEETRRRHAVLVTAPGERYQYSNLGYGLLEQVIARVSGKDFATFMQERVFDPLGLKHTSVGTPGKRRRAAVRYDRNGRPIPLYGFDHDGASAIYSSARDLVVFGMSHLGHTPKGAKPVLTPESAKRMWHKLAPAKDYGVGWAVRHAQGHELVTHGGGMPGVRTTLLLFPERDLAIVVLVNAEVGGDHIEVADSIADDLGVPWRSDNLCSLPAGHPIFGRFKGTLQTPDGTRPMELALDHDGEVTATIGSGPTIALFAVRFEDGSLLAHAYADIGAKAAAGKPTDVAFRLKLRANRLTGSVVALVPRLAASAFFADLTRK